MPLKIKIDPAIELQNTAPSPPLQLKGDYIAVEEAGAQAGTYALHEVDPSTGQPKNSIIAKVHIEVVDANKVQIS